MKMSMPVVDGLMRDVKFDHKAKSVEKVKETHMFPSLCSTYISGINWETHLLITVCMYAFCGKTFVTLCCPNLLSF